MRKPTKLDDIQSVLSNLKVEDHYEPNDFLKLLNILDDLVGEVKRIDGESFRAANTASCLANGVQPD